MATLGQELKRRREEKGLTIKQVAVSTLVGVRFLQGIEDDNYGVLPGGIFNRAFVRKYANEVGLDESTAIQMYEDQLNLQGGEKARSFEMGVENWDAPPTSGNGLLISLIALVLLLVGAWLAYTYFYAAKPEPATPGEAPVASTVVIPTPTPEPTPTPTPEFDGLTLRIETGEAPCWMRITRDAEPAEESIQPPAQTREFSARERMIVNLGNLPTLRITINGRPINQARVVKFPKSVVVTNLLLTRENYLNYVD
jgi:cytoskeleton protein RodZ